MLKEFIFPAMVSVFCFIYYFTTRTYSSESTKFPYMIFVIMAVLAVLILISEYKKNKLALKDNSKNTGSTIDRELLVKQLGILIFAVLYLFLLTQIGYIISTLLFLLITMWFSKVPLKLSLIVCPITTFVLYLIFVIWLNLPIPGGFIESFIKKMF